MQEVKVRHAPACGSHTIHQRKSGLIYMTDDRTRYERIAALAYVLWQQRGSPVGSPDYDWFRAEQELAEKEAGSKLPFASFAFGPVEE